METVTFSAILFAASGYGWDFWMTVLQVAVALGLIIFVHELGHFLVAKACGVRCDKFYIGFDFFGLKLCKIQWGETEYGIGVFPLGGYVKMYGQEDNPGELHDRLEKAKAARETLAKNAEADVAAENRLSDAEIAELERMMDDPRSYQSKSVPQRMGIIVAGVVMNVIFAFCAAALAFSLGTFKTAPSIQDVFAGQAAWESGLQSGDTVVSINGNHVEFFDQIPKYVMLGDDLEKGLPLVYRRPGYEVDQMAQVYPRKFILAPMLGASGSEPKMVLAKGWPYRPLSPVENACLKVAEPQKLVGGERVMAVNGENVENYLAFMKACYRATGGPVTVKFARPSAKQASVEETEKTPSGGILEPLPLEADEKTQVADAYYFDLVFQPKKMRHFGVIFDMGPVQTTQVTINGPGPARRAGILPGDTLLEMETDGKMAPIGDPMTLPFRIHQLAKMQTTVTFKVRRGEKKDQLNISADMPGAGETLEGAKEEIVAVELDKSPVPADLHMPGSGLVIPEIGLCFIPSRRITEVVPGSKAEKDGLKSGDRLLEITLKYEPPKADKNAMSEEEFARQEKISGMFKKSVTRQFRKDLSMIPFIWDEIQAYPLEGTVLEMAAERKMADGTAKRLEAEVPLVEYADVYLWQSDLQMQPGDRILVKGKDFTQSLALGGEETWNSLTLVFRMLEKLFSGQVSVRGLGGPVLIAQAAYDQAKSGWSSLLMFVCLISANLAVMNILPIPILDGGHLVFLLYEGITGRAPNENLVIILSYAGLLLFLGLTIFVFALDLGFIARF